MFCSHKNRIAKRAQRQHMQCDISCKFTDVHLGSLLPSSVSTVKIFMGFMDSQADVRTVLHHARFVSCIHQRVCTSAHYCHPRCLTGLIQHKNALKCAHVAGINVCENNISLSQTSKRGVHVCATYTSVSPLFCLAGHRGSCLCKLHFCTSPPVSVGHRGSCLCDLHF